MRFNHRMPKISIITIAFNSEEYLQQTIQSVAAQTYSDIEYIVVDGGSTDGTLEIIRNNEQHIDRWISEPDNGISDAMNKGIALASGDFIYFLHSDDYLGSSDAIEESCRHLTTTDDIFLFNIYLENDGVKALHQPRGLSPWLRFKNGVYHQSTICSKRLFEDIGLFDESLRIGMDYDFFLRAYRRGTSAVDVDLPLGTMRLTGISSQIDWPSLRQRFSEERLIHRIHAESISMKVIYELYWLFYRLLYFPYRWIRSPARKS